MAMMPISCHHTGRRHRSRACGNSPENLGRQSAREATPGCACAWVETIPQSFHFEATDARILLGPASGFEPGTRHSPRPEAGAVRDGLERANALGLRALLA